MTGRARPGPGSLRATIVIELEGAADAVLQQGAAVLGLIVDELTMARKVNVEVEYGEGSTAEHVLKGAEPDALDLVGCGADGGREAKFWGLAIRAALVAPESETAKDPLDERRI